MRSSKLNKHQRRESIRTAGSCKAGVLNWTSLHDAVWTSGEQRTVQAPAGTAVLQDAESLLGGFAAWSICVDSLLGGTMRQSHLHRPKTVKSFFFEAQEHPADSRMMANSFHMNMQSNKYDRVEGKSSNALF